MIVRDCDFTELGYYFNEKPMGDGSISGAGVRVYNATNVVVTNCTFSRMAICVGSYTSTSCSNLVVQDCTFSDSFVWGVDLGNTTTGTVVDYISIKGNTFANWNQFDQSKWTGYGEFPHTDGIFHRNDYNSGTFGDHINFCGNWFYSTNGGGGGTAAIYCTSASKANIYNNVFAHSGKGADIYINNGASAGSSAQVIRVLNNTFIFGWRKGIWMAGTGVDTIDIRNNAFFCTATNNTAVTYYWTASPTNFTVDYNCYFSSNSAYPFYWQGHYDGGWSAITNAGLEANGQWAWPLFADCSGATADVVGYDLKPQELSPLVGVGAILSSYFTDDYDAVERGAVWDVGAYEYEATPSPLSPGTFTTQTATVGALIIGP